MFFFVSKYGKIYLIIIFLDSIWSKLRDCSTPSEKFKEKLRADLFEQMTKKDEMFFTEYIENIVIPKPRLVLKIERGWSFVSFISRCAEFIRRIFSYCNKSLFKGFAFLGTGVAITLLILPLFSVVSVPRSFALEPSVLRSFSGDIKITHRKTVFSPIDYQELFDFDIVTTAQNSTGEIIFFDGTILRLAENTSLQIIKLAPNSSFISRGEVKLKLLRGNVWLKTFKDSSFEDNDGVLLYTPSFTILPRKSVLSVYYQEGKEWVYDLQNSAVIGVKGINVNDNIIIDKGEMISFSIFDEFTPLPKQIPASFYNLPWVIHNLEKDIEYTSEYLETLSEKMQEKYIMSTLSTQVEEFLRSNPTDEKLSLFLNDINSLLLVLDEAHKEKESEEQFTPTPIPNTLSSKKVRIRKHTIPLEKNTTIYSKKDSIQETFSIEDTSENIEKNEDEKTGEKSEKNTESNTVEKKSQKLTAQQIAEKRRAKQREEQIKAAVNSFSQQVNVFKFENSRKTTALRIINNIPKTPENLELLRRIEMSAPLDVKKIVRRRRIEIEKLQLHNASQ